jgi:pimeloyl-ACP methyl ester carboxylesterase
MSSPVPLGQLPYAAPEGSLIRAELRFVRELPRLIAAARALAQAPRGEQLVVAFPGFRTGDRATWPLRTFLGSRGHDCHGWGIGVNRGEVGEDLDTIIDIVSTRVQAAGTPAAVIGWSLGGVFAREVARSQPDLVSRVFTFGTPVIGGPRYTRSASAYSSERLDAIETQINERNLTPIERPITAFFSKRDGAVDWRACIDNDSPDVRNIEVTSSHTGMILDRDIWLPIAATLAS